MIVRRFFEPLIAQNSYLIGCAAAGEAIVIDANRDVQHYIDAAAADNLTIVQVTETTSTQTSSRDHESWRTGRAPVFVFPTKADPTGSISSTTTR